MHLILSKVPWLLQNQISWSSFSSCIVGFNPLEMQMDLLKCLSFSEILSNLCCPPDISWSNSHWVMHWNTVITTLTKILPSLAMPKKKVLIFSFLNIKFLQFLIWSWALLRKNVEEKGKLHQSFSPCLTSNKVIMHTPMLGRIIWLIHSFHMHGQPCLTLCDPMDCSFPGFSVHAIL